MEKHRNPSLRILYISQYFPPEVGATQSRAFDMAYYLSERGHKVTVLCEFPNHPSGILPARYRRKFWERRRMRRFRVCRCWVYATPQKTFVTRLLFYLSFMCSSIAAGLFLRDKFDVVYTTSPPLFVGVSGYILSRLKNAKFVFEVRDLWPESAVALGELRNPGFIKRAGKLETFFYRKAEKIVGVTSGILENLMNRGVNPEKLQLIKNGTNIHLFKNRGDHKKDDLNLRGRFVVGYFGIFGLAQGMEQLCELAERMKIYPDVHFLFVGDGPKKQNVLDLKSEKQLTNLTILNEIRREEIAEYISACDAALVPLRKNELFTGALPSKMFDNMACERPIILSVAGEAQKVLKDAESGIFVEPENTAQMMEAILKLKSDPELCKRMGRNGRRFVEKYFSRKKLALELEACLQRIRNFSGRENFEI
ncbi:alpha-D-kanosaminyltransferase [bacterium BMS3Bbin03]|nr:alpha-D-kanosaminyltransferase [bacterium BMS3Bbin03]